ncbi:MAG: hypothetical protein K0S38_623 [Candidatus Paceibacter sp.]|jgi:hypothetical protein|nr:hypothetical protein [Candidatus Paceibacter sp.]
MYKKYLGVLAICMGLLNFAGLGMALFYISIQGGNGIQDVIDQPLILAILSFVIIIALLWVISGIAYLSQKNWSIKTLFILACISLFSFPVGTVIGLLFILHLYKFLFPAQNPIQ